MFQWLFGKSTPKYIDIPVWYRDKLGCRIDVCVISVPEHYTSEKCKPIVIELADKKLKYTTTKVYWGEYVNE